VCYVERHLNELRPSNKPVLAFLSTSPNSYSWNGSVPVPYYLFEYLIWILLPLRIHNSDSFLSDKLNF
jgi:hypothetical protein